MMKRRVENHHYNYPILWIVLVLLCFGLIMVYSASHHIAMKRFQDSSLFFRNHLYRILAGLLVLLITAYVPYKFWLRLSKLWLLLGIGLLIAVLLMGEGNHATRWLRLFGIRFQPVDFARLALILYLTNAMVRNREYLHYLKEGFLPQLIVVGVISYLILQQPDFGSTLILIVISLVIFITAGVRFRHLLLLTLPGIGGFLIIFLRPYQFVRLKAFFNSIFHGVPLSYQIQQSLISLGNGGLFGCGLDNSTQKLEFLPEPFTDFIFAIVGEEFGFVGSVFILTLFLILIMEGYRIAHRCKDEGGAILAVGLTTSLGLYAFINAGVVCNLFPTKGLPMPFISYGGSFMLSVLASAGMLLNISQHNEFRLSSWGPDREVFRPGNRSRRRRKNARS